jgi:DNA processing protein
VLVACSAAVVVVQAPLRSGARNAALWARRLGRPLFVVPHAPWEAAGAGCVEELKLGATPLTSAKQVVRALTDRGHVCFGTTRVQQRGPTLDRESPQQLGFAGLDPNTAREPAGGDARPDPVVAALDGGARSLDELHAITGVPIAQLRADLSRCVLDGRLRELEDGRYAKAELARE